MPLLKICKGYIGRNLFVLPYGGCGWSRPDIGKPADDPLDIGPEPFHVKIQEMIFCKDELVGASGVIVEQGHQFDGYWCCFYLRLTSDHDFADKIGDYVTWIAPAKLPVKAAPDKARGDWVELDKKSFVLCGLTMVAESSENMRQTYDIVVELRKRVPKQK